MGRLLDSNLRNLGLRSMVEDTLADLGQHLEAIEETEADAALGNGGLGRLAACFLDSLATLDLPGYGYGINYEFGLFKQHIENGYQKERPDHWLHEDTPWLIERPDDICVIPLYGRVEHHQINGNYRPIWVDWQVLIGVPFDMPIVGYGGRTVNALRLYSARASNEFNIKIFNGGDYIKAVEAKISSETISKVLYPSDSCWGGKELRLVQEYFLVACALRDILTRYLKQHKELARLPEKVVIQLNDTHPSLTVAELMRILIDDYQFTWNAAWEVTCQCCAYTNHTLLPEALEKWPVALLEHVLPRHLQIIYEINRHFLDMVAQRHPGDNEVLARLSLVEENWDNKQIRMAHLAIVGSFSVNGVAAIHSELVKTRLVPDFYNLWPERFNNKTNGVTPRRWLAQANPGLARLLTETVGPQWVSNLEHVRGIESYAMDSAFQLEFNRIKRANKERLARHIDQTLQISLDPDSLFDVQIKRIHEYKRQLLNILHVIHQYLSIVEDGQELPTSKTYLFGGKAAPGYVMAKLIIKLINSVGETVNHDPRARDRIKVVFLPDYRVSLAEKIIPAANLSEQISTAGTEASGTGNMKLSMNGALTIGTLDGANIEILEEVGPDNIYIFGHTTDEIEQMRHNHAYHSRADYEAHNFIRRILDNLTNNRFCPHEPGIFQPIVNMLLDGGDYFFHLADLDAYRQAQEQVGQDYIDTKDWTRKAILNVARMGKFSSDRTIREYAREVWKIEPVLPEEEPLPSKTRKRKKTEIETV